MSYYIALVETYDDPIPLRGPFPNFDAAVVAHFEAAIEAGVEFDESDNAHLYYLQDDAVRIARVISAA